MLNVPAQYLTHSDLESAYRDGFNHGHGLACHNVPRIGDKLWLDDMGRVTVDAENIREVHQSLCYAAESNSRCFSPFEFTAHEFNSADSDQWFVLEDEDGTFYVSTPSEDGIERGFETADLAQEFIDATPCAEELWEAFEAGTADAISADLATYTDADYGIEDASADA